jgi:hypothetical protein
VTAAPDIARPGYTVLGWRVGDIRAVSADLMASVWTTPGGDEGTWFTDPDGNTQSLTEFA